MQTSFRIARFTYHIDGFLALMGIHFTPQLYQTPGLKPLLCDDNHIKKDVGEKKRSKQVKNSSLKKQKQKERARKKRRR